MILVIAVALLGCRNEPAAPSHAPPIEVVRDAAAPDAPTPDAALTLDGALAELRTHDAPSLADVIARRIAQTAPKMRLAPDEGQRAAVAVLAILDRPGVRALAAVMPRSTVELARAVAERDLPIDELDRITAYLVRVVAAIAPERLATFDDNHSHVTGRDWHEIDYSGESMTWQGQRDAWVPQGVTSFKQATAIHAYFVGAERLAHWRRVYKPRGTLATVAPP